MGARSREQVEAVAEEIGGRWVQMDVADRRSVERAVARWGRSTCSSRMPASWARAGCVGDIDPADWSHVYEVNVLGVHLCCRAVIPGMLERGGGRIVITGSGAAYLPGSERTAYPPEQGGGLPLRRNARERLAGRIPVFFFSPGLVRTEMTEGAFGQDAPWTPPELAPELVRKLATGRYDALAGRYLHAEHDDIDELLARIDEVRERDLNAIRLQR